MTFRAYATRGDTRGEGVRMTKASGIQRLTRAALAALALLAVLVFAACGEDEAEEAAGGGAETVTEAAQEAAPQDVGLMKSGTLTVGMNLQFEPQMYLKDGQPAGYDVDLLNKIAPAMQAKLDIQNLDFNGLIPGLQSKKFDMVSVGLSNTPERAKAVDFTRAYVPYVQVLATGKADAGATDPAAFNKSGKTITALQGSTGEQLAKKLFPEAEVKGLPDQNAAFLEVATGRADGIVVEDYLLAQFQKTNPDKLEKAAFPEPLDVQYGSYAVQKGNKELVTFLDAWLCKAQLDGTLEETYKKNFGVEEFPEMPSCP